jgi:hypothetical protein
MNPEADQYANAVDRVNGGAQLAFTGTEDLTYLVIAAVAIIAIGLILWRTA